LVGHADGRGLSARGSGEGDGGKRVGGVEGTVSLIKAALSVGGVERGLRALGEELFYIQLWSDILSTPALRSMAVNDPNLPTITLTPTASDDATTIFDAQIASFVTIRKRAETMIVRHVAADVESELKTHLTRSVISHHDLLRQTLASKT
jgi:hypothetical protein